MKRQARAGVGHRSFSRGHTRTARLLIGLGIVGALVGSTPGLAAAVPPPPPNPSDSDIAQAQTQVTSGLGQVSELINQVASADQQLAQLDNEVAIKREDVNRALVDLQNARSAADLAAGVVGASQQALRDAGAQIDLAQKDFDKYARSSYTQGTNVSAISTYLGAQGPGDVLDRAQVLKLLATSQNAVLEGLQRARTAQANKDSAAREAKQQADAAADQAESKKSLAEQAIAIARSALQDQAVKKAQIESNRAAAQAQLEAARGNVEGLQGQREAYTTWDDQRRAEEAQKAAIAAAAREAATQAAARVAANEAARQRAAELAAGQRAHTTIEEDSESDGESTTPKSTPKSKPSTSGEDLTGSEAIETVIDRGLSQIGVEYAWGGGDENGPTKGIRDGGVADSYGDFNKIGFDCSGLMIYAFAGIGISLPHYTGYQYTAGEQVPSEEMQRGDMIFWGPNASQHVALYLGDDQMLEAPESGDVVKISPVRWDGMTPYAVRMVS
ncbi:Cell wall-associated hydrolase, NlpC family [Rhodococcus jostii]|uniref:Cell wall-associated hydrolase, NlpC family n=2 Tax=Rhodococcus jostii TaxID=132919 RepID=A0A1H4RKM8_RHOJO|nr:Cell wall-associated hydrolase, NlpC family [Rhodococcus jostii]